VDLNIVKLTTVVVVEKAVEAEKVAEAVLSQTPLRKTSRNRLRIAGTSITTLISS
jgi:hypothetical protein